MDQELGVEPVDMVSEPVDMVSEPVDMVLEPVDMVVMWLLCQPSPKNWVFGFLAGALEEGILCVCSHVIIVTEPGSRAEAVGMTDKWVRLGFATYRKLT